MKKIILLAFLAPTFLSLCAQEATKFGLNTIYDDPTFNMLISTNNKKVVDVAKNFHIQFLRYPGGTVSRTYFWDRVDLIPKAFQLYSNYVATNVGNSANPDKKKAKAGYYNNKADNIEMGTVSLGDSIYTDFLLFCKKNAVTPIIVMNSWYYHDANSVYKILNDDNVNIDNSKWNAILDNVKKQLQFTHKFIGQVYWEIGNEDPHVYPPESYSNIASKFATVIKSLYPDDKVILQYANPESQKVTTDWNGSMINCLVKSKTINLIDFVAPHYYRAFEDVVQTEADLQKRINKVDIYSKWQTLVAPINPYPKIQLFYTEYGVFKKIVHPNYNTQMHGLMMLYYLMTFNATPKVYGVIQHSFTQKSTGILFDAGTFSNLNYGFNPTDLPSDNFFKYVPPQAKAVKIFYANNPVKAQSLQLNNQYAYTVSNTTDRTIINILNFSNQSLTLKLSDMASYNSSAKVSMNQYKFTDLNSKQWDYAANTSSSTVNNGTVQLNKISYTVISIQK